MKGLVIGLLAAVLIGPAAEAATSFYIQGSGFDSCTDKRGEPCAMNKRMRGIAPYDGSFSISDEASNLAGRRIEFSGASHPGGQPEVLPWEWLDFDIPVLDGYEYRRNDSKTLLLLSFDAAGQVSRWYLGTAWYDPESPGHLLATSGGSHTTEFYYSGRYGRTYHGTPGTLTQGGPEPTWPPTPVPVPPALALMLTGLAGLWLARRRA